MNIKDILLLIATNSVITTILLAIAGFIGRSLIENSLSKRLEKYKIELQATHDKELETLKAKLAKSQFEYESQFTKFNDKKIEIIENLYKLLVKHSLGLNKMISKFKDAQAKDKLIEVFSFTDLISDGNDQESEDEFPKTWWNAYSYFLENRLYLSEDLSKTIEKQLLTGYVALLPVASRTNFEESEPFIPSDLYEILKMLKDCDTLKIASESATKFNEILGELEKEFRSFPNA